MKECKPYLIKMEPDANALFWNDNESDEERGFCIGDDEHLTLPGHDVNFFQKTAS
ncbi:MAG: hypothetical protein K6A42_03930 [Treponema sp.]|nr:hypothetical protein [Treponema sp.]